MVDIDRVAFTAGEESGPPLVPVIAQHARTGEVLMVAWSDRIALERTVAERRLWLWSRRRRRLWLKGESSGNVLHVETLLLDCDGDTILALVRPGGPACHTGNRSCFGAAAPTLRALADLIEARRTSPMPNDGRSYTVRLLRDQNLRLKKLGEESVELALACARADSSADGGGRRVAEEAADLIYHTLVSCAASGVDVDAILDRLATRMRDGPQRGT